MNKIHYSSKKDDWCTPRWLFDLLNSRYNFTLDLFASENNALCSKYLTDCFTQDWKGDGYAFGNPPYRGKKPTTWDFVKITHEKYLDKVRCSVLLLPARTDTKIWHEVCMQHKIYFIKGRLHFNDGPVGAPFPSAVVVFGETGIGAIDSCGQCFL